MNYIHDVNADMDAAAEVAAKTLNIGNAIFRQVPVGGVFRFAYSSESLTKVSSTTYTNGVRRFITGQRAAVFFP